MKSLALIIAGLAVLLIPNHAATHFDVWAAALLVLWAMPDDDDCCKKTRKPEKSGKERGFTNP